MWQYKKINYIQSTFFKTKQEILTKKRRHCSSRFYINIWIFSVFDTHFKIFGKFSTKYDGTKF